MDLFVYRYYVMMYKLAGCQLAIIHFYVVNFAYLNCSQFLPFFFCIYG